MIFYSTIDYSEIKLYLKIKFIKNLALTTTIIISCKENNNAAVVLSVDDTEGSGGLR